jgi:cytoskeletal protein CcmA (bactofilin family)
VKYRLIILLMVWSPAWAGAEPLTMFALFGGSSGVLGSNVVVNTGTVGSGQGLTLANNVITAGLLGGGSFNAGANGLATPTGDIVFNGDVVIPDNAHVSGNIDSGGHVSIGANATVNGSIRSAGTIDIGTNARIGGNLDSSAATGVSITLRENSNVLGAITRKPGSTANFAASSTFGSDAQGVPLAPTAFGGVALPSESPFAAGTVSVLQLANASTNLLPGTYSSVNLGANNILNLSSGA